jgi:hypothetical protein
VVKGRKNNIQDLYNVEQPVVGHQPRKPNVVSNNGGRPLSTSKERPYMQKPPAKPATVMKQYESQEIFG